MDSNVLYDRKYQQYYLILIYNAFKSFCRAHEDLLKPSTHVRCIFLYIYICISTVLKRIVELKKDILVNLQYWQENSQTILGKVLPKQYQDLSVYPKEHINLYITRFLSWEKTWMKLSVCNSPSKLLEIFLTYTTNFTE